MKLATDIKPRMDGTVVAHVADATYEFKGQPLECDVENEEHSAFLLNTGSFFPSDSADFGRAELQISPLLTGVTAGGTINDDDGDDDDDTDSSEVLNGGAPLEALTPVKASTKPARKVK